MAVREVCVDGIDCCGTGTRERLRYLLLDLL